MQKRIGNVRWFIAILLGIGIVINYLDRVNISVAAKPLIAEYHLSNADLGIILSSFLWSYTILQIPVGTLLDKFGVKWLVRIGTILWSLATFMTAVVSGFGLIILSRVLLGIAEAPAFPGASKATGYWFPVRERGLSTSAFDAAAKFSSVIGVPLVAFVVTIYGWRGGFFVTGILSILYAIAFWIWYRDPRESKQVSKEEYNYIVEGGAQPENAVPTNSLANLGYMLRQRKVWGLTLGFTAYNYSFYLFLLWLPPYLETQLHLTVLSTGWYAIIPWIVATLTDIFIGGWLVDRLIRSGFEPTRVRKTLLTIGMLLGITVIGAAFTRSATIAIIWISIALGGLAFSAPIGWSIPALIAPKGSVGTVGSIMNFVSNAAGIAAPILAGIVADRTGSFALNFIIAAAILVAGILCYLFLLGKIEQIEAPPTIAEAPYEEIKKAS